MMRVKEGFYWVSDGGAPPEVAELRDGAWWLIGSEESAIGRCIVLLSERLSIPHCSEQRLPNARVEIGSTEASATTDDA